MTQGVRLGILGGTFNPVHLGHLRAAEEVREALDLERVLLVPSAEPPHKHGSAKDPIAPAQARLAWLREAVAGNPGLEVDPLEIERGGRSFTFETVERIGARTAPEPPVFLIGCDAFEQLDSWREPKRLLARCHFAVMTRPPSRGRLLDWLPAALRGEVVLSPDGSSAQHREAPTWIRTVRISALDISSSDIRERIRTGRSVRYLLPEPVRQAALASGVYAGREAQYCKESS